MTTGLLHRRPFEPGLVIAVAVFAFANSLAATPAAPKANLSWQDAICAGRYEGHLQGIAVDGTGAIYWSFTLHLVKTDPTGKILKKVKAPDHAGDVAYHGGKLYCAVNQGAFNEEPGKADSQVWIYDGNSLEVLAKHKTPQVVHGAGGMTWHANKFYLVGGLPPTHQQNYVYEYDEMFRFIRRHVLPSGYTKLGIQNACFADGFFWFGCYGNKLLKADPALKLIAQFDIDCGYGIVGLGKKEMLVGRAVGGDHRRGQVLRFVQDGKLGLRRK